MKSYPLLSKIKKPQDIQHFSIEKLKDLSKEIRSRIIEVLSINGGHLSSNLGTVELSIALHYIFSSPDDKMIFDVSHQSYPHKLLTGRHSNFETIRQHKGLSGFCHPKESKHDHFYAGHAGTAFSLALGCAKNRDMQEKTEHIIPIIGDASLTCGLTLEALNNIPNDLKRFIVILNDNKMSISDSVGNIKHILSRLINNPTSNKLYHEVQTLLSKVPGYGHQLAKQGQKFKESIKNLVSPAAFFEQFGLAYIGPIDGHDIKKLIDTFSSVKDLHSPVIVHLMTVKGKGMSIASENPTTYHGVKPFDVESGKFLAAKSIKPTFPKIFGRHLMKMAEKDPNIIVINPATPAGSCLSDFMKKYPDRCLDVGIAEGHAVTYCGGLALGKNLKVIMNVYATFMQRALDNLFHDICLQELPVVFTLDRSFISGPDGSTHHGIYDIAFFNSMPNMVITQPRDGVVLKELLESAFSWERPVCIRYPNLPADEPTQKIKKRKLANAEVLSQGKDILLISLGHMNQKAMEVKKLLQEKGLNPTVVDPVFLKPLDSDLFYELISTHIYIVTIEEHSLIGGLGSIMNNFIMKNNLNRNIQILNIGVPDTFVQHGKNQILYEELGLDPKSIAKQIISHFEKPDKLAGIHHDHRTVSQ